MIMGRPTAEEISRSLDDLEAAARGWLAQADVMAAKAPYYSGPIADGLAWGVFIPLGLAYQQACQALADAAHTGGHRLDMVGSTLLAVRDQYERDEDNNVHEAQGRW